MARDGQVPSIHRYENVVAKPRTPHAKVAYGLDRSSFDYGVPKMESKLADFPGFGVSFFGFPPIQNRQHRDESQR